MAVFAHIWIKSACCLLWDGGKMPVLLCFGMFWIWSLTWIYSKSSLHADLIMEVVAKQLHALPSLWLNRDTRQRNKPRVLNGWAVKRYSGPVLPRLAGKLTEQRFITFLQRLANALRQNITYIHRLHVKANMLLCIHSPSLSWLTMEGK